MVFGFRGCLGRASASRAMGRGPDGLLVNLYINLTRELKDQRMGDKDQVTIP